MKLSPITTPALSTEYRRKKNAEAAACIGRPVSLQSGHFIAYLDSDFIVETWGRGARRRILLVISRRNLI